MVKDTFFDPKTMTITLVVETVAAILGTLLGKFIYNKFFNKNIKREGMLS